MADENQDVGSEPVTRHVGAHTSERPNLTLEEQRAAIARRQAEAEQDAAERARQEQELRTRNADTINNISEAFGIIPENIDVYSNGQISVNLNGLNSNPVITHLLAKRVEEELGSNAVTTNENSNTIILDKTLLGSDGKLSDEARDKIEGVIASNPVPPQERRLKELGFENVTIASNSISFSFPPGAENDRDTYLAQINSALGEPYAAMSMGGKVGFNPDRLAKMTEAELATLAKFKDGIVPGASTETPDQKMDKAAEELSKITGMKVEHVDIQGNAAGAFVVRNAGHNTQADIIKGDDLQVTHMIDDVLVKARNEAGISRDALSFSEGNKFGVPVDNLTANDLYITADPKTVMATVEKLKAEGAEIQAGITEITAKTPEQMAPGKQGAVEQDQTQLAGSAQDDRLRAAPEVQTVSLDPKANIFAGRSDAEREHMNAVSQTLQEERVTADFNREKERLGLAEPKKAQVVEGAVQTAPPIVTTAEAVGPEALTKPAPAAPIPATRPSEAELVDTKEEVIKAQTLLAEAKKKINPLGTFANDGKDGIKGEVTEGLIKEAQREAGLPENGRLTDDTMKALQAQADKAQGREPAKPEITQPAPTVTAAASPPVPVMLDDASEHAKPQPENVAAWLESVKANLDAQSKTPPAQLNHRQAEDRGMETYLQDAKSIGDGMANKPVGPMVDVATNDDVPAALTGGKQRSAAAGMTA